VIDTTELQTIFGIQSQLVNDFEAVAHSLPVLRPANLANSGGGAGDTTAPLAVLGPGTGLAGACFVPVGDKPIVIPSEGGHATLAICNREDQIIGQLRQVFGHASAERAISGPGLENIYQAIGALEQVQTPTKDCATRGRPIT
jgi:glucokinase